MRMVDFAVDLAGGEIYRRIGGFNKFMRDYIKTYRQAHKAHKTERRCGYL